MGSEARRTKPAKCPTQGSLVHMLSPLGAVSFAGSEGRQHGVWGRQMWAPAIHPAPCEPLGCKSWDGINGIFLKGSGWEWGLGSQKDLDLSLTPLLPSCVFLCKWLNLSECQVHHVSSGDNASVSIIKVPWRCTDVMHVST